MVQHSVSSPCPASCFLYPGFRKSKAAWAVCVLQEKSESRKQGCSGTEKDFFLFLCPGVVCPGCSLPGRPGIACLSCLHTHGLQTEVLCVCSVCCPVYGHFMAVCNAISELTLWGMDFVLIK